MTKRYSVDLTLTELETIHHTLDNFRSPFGGRIPVPQRRAREKIGEAIAVARHLRDHPAKTPRT